MCSHISAPPLTRARKWLTGTQRGFARVICMAQIFCISVGQNVGEFLQQGQGLVNGPDRIIICEEGSIMCNSLCCVLGLWTQQACERTKDS